MKVLLLSNTAGQGHLSTATALKDMLTDMGAECRLLDSYAYINPVLSKTISQGYLIATSSVPMAYGKFYRIFENRTQHGRKRSATSIANTAMTIKMRKFISAFKPDVIICTHVFSAQIVNTLKQRGEIDALIMGIVTDYTIHPFWEEVTAIDYVVTASELLTRRAVKKGIQKEKILPLGIPISSKFSIKTDKTEARRQLGIDPNKPTILLMSGSMGYGNMNKVLKSIDQLEMDFQLLAVCGNNAQAKQEIESLQTVKKVYVYGFVNNVELMMDASDCIVTKPGGLSTSEALAKMLPIVMINPIPGQEERNVEFLLNNGLAMNATETYPVDEAIAQLFHYPEKLRYMRENIRLVSKPNATRDICEFVMKMKR